VVESVTADAVAGTGTGVAGVVLLEVDCFSEEALRLPFETDPLVGVTFFSGALYTKGADVGIVDVIIEVEFV
jgi:hypothetical protein